MDVGGFAEPRKILCLSVLSPPMSNYQYITGRRISPTENTNMAWKNAIGVEYKGKITFFNVKEIHVW